jgi:aspartate-semialdehyde dehydrogenase
MSAVAIVNPSDLLGKEIRETLERRAGGPWGEIRLLTTRSDEAGALTELAGGAALIAPLDADALDGIDLAFFCGTAAEIAAGLSRLPPEATAVVLAPPASGSPPLAATAGRLAGARPVVAGVNGEAARPGARAADGHGRILLSPHPSVVLLAHLLHPLAELGLEEAVATVVQPASVAGDRGLDELFEQTRQIVAMRERRASPVFGAQLAFNLLPVAAPAGDLAATLAAVLPGARPLSFQLLQGGVFHSLAASLFVRLAGAPGVKGVRKALADHAEIELVKKPSHLGPIDAAASDKVLVGAVQEDPAIAGGYWLWGVMDNLTRGGALNAIEIAEQAL